MLDADIHSAPPAAVLISTTASVKIATGASISAATPLATVQAPR